MRFFLLLLLIMAITPLAEMFLPWWMIAVVPFLLAAAVHPKTGLAFLAGFLGIAIFWLVAALMKDLPNNHILSKKMATLFQVGDYRFFLLIVCLLGGIIGGLSAWSGALIREKRHVSQKV